MRELLDNTWQQWSSAGASFLASYVLLNLFRSRVMERLKRVAGKTSMAWDDFLIDLVKTKTKTLVLVAIAIWIASWFLVLPERVQWLIRNAVLIAFGLQGVWWGNAAVQFWVSRKNREAGAQDQASASAYGAISFIARLLLWSLVLLMVLRNLGIDITGLVAGLGIGGIAVALAAQNILGDLFASLCIVLDKPFAVGDFIDAGGGCLGLVESVGLKTTRLRSLTGEQIVLANTDLLKNPIRNYKRMQERRVVFSLGVTYQTPAEKLSRIPELIKEMVAKVPNTRFDRAHFAQYGDFALLYEVVYYVTSPDYLVFMDTRHEINLAIYSRFAAEGIEFAYPTQTVFVADTRGSCSVTK